MMTRFWNELCVHFCLPGSSQTPQSYGRATVPHVGREQCYSDLSATSQVIVFDAVGWAAARASGL